MKLRGSHLVSFAILAGIGGWMFTGDLILGGQADPNAKTISEREATRTSDTFRVRTTTIQPSSRTEQLDIRGRTQANAMVAVRAETGGTVENRLVKKGQMVVAGDLLCVIDRGVRDTNLDQAKAQLSQAEADYEANKSLVDRGFATKSKLRGLKASMDAAKAAIASASQEISRTEIKATTSGIVQMPMASIGDNLAPGGVCTTLVQSDPMLFTGQVSERDVFDLQLGMPAKIALVGNQTRLGKIKFISPVADAQTRTFSVEIEIENADQSLKDGMTSSAKIDLKPVDAYKLEPSWLTLADDGEVGVRVVDNASLVKFVPVKILSQEQKYIWVNGLKPNTQIITLGQNYVITGQKVEAINAADLKSLEKAKPSVAEGTNS